MPNLVLGPLLRYVGEACAVVWVETDGECEVAVLGTTSSTFTVAGHHYAVVRSEGLTPGRRYSYEVELDGERVWPLPDSPFPPSSFRARPKPPPLRISFGSCRVGAPHEPPHTQSRDDDPDGRGLDALRALALRMADQDPDDWPDLLLLLGDQVYADEASPRTREFVEARRDIDEPPGPIALDFEEYTRLYRETWSDPVIRWLLSTVSSAMIFDDHDVHDDWNISSAWVDEMNATDWWEEHIVGAIMSYWIYQHAGNLSPDEQDRDGLLARCHEAGDAEGLLRDFASRSAHTTDGVRWSYHRDLDGTRLLVIDSRAGRCLDEGDRSMLDGDEWRWGADQMSGDFDHLLIASSLPWLLAPGMHYVEAWSEAVCGGAWGPLAARAGERNRQGLDLEHWAAFGESLARMMGILKAVGTGERGEAPATIVALSGDVHHAYLAEVGFPPGTGMRSTAWQATCSPFRNPLDKKERTVMRFMASEPAERLMRALAHSAGVEDPPVRWRYVHDDPWFDNQVATLELDGRRARLRIEKTVPPGDDAGDPALRLEQVFERELA
jgi:hypothetical protein